MARAAAVRPAAPATNFASRSVPRHLARGVIGVGLIVGAIALVPVAGPVALLAAPPALVAFRGCPTCWLIGLAQTISRGRLERQCDDGVCTLGKPRQEAEDPGPRSSRPGTHVRPGR
ncbi:hypothetical protein [Streptodolium elevatio]